ncbi:MAG: class I SAM-dependent methyltransferase [Planctomycetes bacterium]|nr:class I SAM-dependent methyltransferase [Planctomycetota bacterium]
MQEHLNSREYWDKRLQTYPGLKGVGHTKLGQCYNRWLYRLRKTVFLRSIQALKLDYHNLRVLDIGCGTGFYIDLWQRLGVKSMSGIDIAPTSVKMLAAKYPEFAFHNLDIGTPLPDSVIKSASIDVVTAFDVLGHIVDDQHYQSALKNISRLLKPDGYFIFSDALMQRNIFRTYQEVWRPEGWVKDILSQMGFRVLRQSPIFILMAIPFNSPHRWRIALWYRFENIIQRNELAGYIIGLILYPLEVLFTRMLTKKPSTQLVICQKV